MIWLPITNWPNIFGQGTNFSGTKAIQDDTGGDYSEQFLYKYIYKFSSYFD